MSVTSADGVWILALLFLGGMFGMMFTFLFEKVTLKHPLPGPVGAAAVILVVSLYLFTQVALQPDTVAFLVPPP
jgi:uncharacterized oligopeptide transporter (OPT) family protein